MTHHVVDLWQRHGTHHRSLCGRLVSTHDAATRPTCPVCARLLALMEAEDAETALALEREYQEFRGKLGTGNHE